jgi:hypothetical protein
MKSLNASPDPSYNAVNLSIYAIAEVFVGVFTACLPPLRKFFDDLLKKILPAGMVSSWATRDSYALKGFSHRSDATRDSRPKAESDGDSDYAILEENRSGVQGVDAEITKTTRVSVTVNSKALTDHRSNDWV